MKILKITIIFFAVIVLAWLLYRNIPYLTPTSRINEGKILVKTHWMGAGDYVKFTPALNTHGCWSTTFSQIAYYLRLEPTGISNYKCSKGYKIHENLNNYKFNWNEFRNKITDSTSKNAVNEISLYCYLIATIVQKDFGTGRYITKMPPIENIEKQLNVNASLYFNYKGLFQSERKIKNIIIREIEANRPMFFYYRNMSVKGSGHSVVLDGYRFDDNTFKVHFNFGWGGRNDGWYNPFKSIVVKGDNELHMLITVRPISKS